jgi:hypothetical protein
MPCNASDLVHIEVLVLRFDPGYGSRSREGMLHDTADGTLQMFKTCNPTRLKFRWLHPKNKGRLGEVYIHVEDYSEANLNFS